MVFSSHDPFSRRFAAANQKRRPKGGASFADAYRASFSHFWLATPQLVLQADWQEVWHSPQPPFFALSHRLRVSSVLILSMIVILHSVLILWPSAKSACAWRRQPVDLEKF